MANKKNATDTVGNNAAPQPMDGVNAPVVPVVTPAVVPAVVPPPSGQTGAIPGEASKTAQEKTTASLMAQIRQAAQALSPDQRRHLDSHLLVNKMHSVNEACFNEVDTFRQMTITFTNLRANSKAFLSIRPDQHAIWSEGGEQSRMVGLSVSTGVSPALFVRDFLINAREMFLQTFADCSEINISLYVRTSQLNLKGKVDLPPGASVTLQSRCDRSSVIGLSSFALDLE